MLTDQVDDDTVKRLQAEVDAAARPRRSAWIGPAPGSR